MDTLIRGDSRIILPLNRNQTAFDCLLTINGRDYAVHLIAPYYPYLRQCSLSVPWNVKSLLEDWLKSYDYESEHIATFLDKIMAHIKESQNYIVAGENGIETGSADYSQILEDIHDIGWKNLHSINTDFTEVKLKLKDSKQREHILTIKLNGKFPEIITELPENLVYTWKPSSNLRDVYSEFCQAVDQYMEFWEVMDELDESCWILEPEKPSTRDKYRKIAISPNVSLKIEVNHTSPRTFPQMVWLGSETAVVSFRDKIANRMETWEPGQSISFNLEQILDLKLPFKENNVQAVEEFEVTCCICYSNRLNGEVPSKICDNTQCGQSFHIFCLYEWLRSLTGSRKLGSKVFGVCPYCETAISCKPPESS